MRLDDYDEADGKRVWLTMEEIERFIDEAQDSRQRVAFTLGGKSGLRREEIVSVTRNDFMYGSQGFVRVWGDYAKKDKYREAPIPAGFQDYVDGLTEDGDPGEPVVDVSGTTVYRWVRRAAERLQAETGDRGWSFLKVHDLRRSWGGHLLWNCGVLPAVVQEFGGWEDYDTFAEHYMGEITPEAAQRERSKISYDPDEIAQVGTDSVAFNPRSPAISEAYSHGGQSYRQ